MKRMLALYLPFLSTDRLCRREHEASVVAKGEGLAAPLLAKTEGRAAPLLAKEGPGEVEKRDSPRSPLGKGGGGAPVVTIAPQGQVLRVVHVNRSARELRIRRGQTLADAKAIVPSLVTYDDDPQADRRQLETLAVWAGNLSPVVHIEDEATLIVDITGCQLLFGGEPNLLRTAADGLTDQGFTVRAAIADTLGAAWALTRAHPEPTVIAEPARTVAHLAPLPVWSLRVDDNTIELLASVGVETVESLLHLPRSSLPLRFGQELLDRLDQALGDLPEVLTPYRPQPAVTARFEWEAPTTRWDHLKEAANRALQRFCEKLAQRVVAVRQLFVTFYCPNVESEDGRRTRKITFPVNLSQPTRSAEHLFPLMLVALETLRLPAPADAVMIWTRETEPFDGWQDELFSTNTADARELSNLVDRLSVRLGSNAVLSPRLLNDHQPERAFRYLPVTKDGIGKRLRERAPIAGWHGQTRLPVGPTSNTSAWHARPGWHARHQAGMFAPSAPRPLRLLPRPIEIAATSLVPDGPPIAFRLYGIHHAVAESRGPERIETGWWRGPHVQRDYYRVVTDQGRRAWIYRDRKTGTWFLHGWFD